MRFIEYNEGIETLVDSAPNLAKIKGRVAEIKASEEVGVRFMQRWEEEALIRHEGKQEGIQEGIIEGKKEGKTRPNVATIPPKIPVVLKPAKVAILTPIGPGVDSDMAIISVSSDVENQEYFLLKSNKKGIVAAPPPMANNPMQKNS